MIGRFQKSVRSSARAFAIVVSALLLVSQTVGAAHFHAGPVSLGIVAAQSGADQGLCPICQLALHSLGSVSAATTVERGPDIAEKISIDEQTRSQSPVFSSARVRAPPISL